MKAFLLIVLLCLIAVPAFAVEGEIYFGAFLDSNYRAFPNDLNGSAKFVSGVELRQKIEAPIIVTPWVKLETIMDGQNKIGTFHPSSIRYDVGIQADIYKSLYIDISHMCWHSIDRNGGTEYYNLLKLGYKF